MPTTSESAATDDRPRERLLRLGAHALSNTELLTLLIGTGSAGRSASDVAGDILHRFDGDLRMVARAGAARLARCDGVGRALATRLVAALELGRRAAAEPDEPDGGPPRIRGPADVHRLIGPRLRDLPHEEFHVLLLTAQHRVIRTVQVTRGILDASLIHPRELFREAIVENAGAVVLVHNHPSGDPTPSAEDRAVTRQLVEAGRVLGIPVVDHVVVGDGVFVSLMEDGGLG